MLKRLEEQSDSDAHAGCDLDVNSDPTESLEERLAGLDLGKWPNMQSHCRVQNFGISWQLCRINSLEGLCCRIIA